MQTNQPKQSLKRKSSTIELVTKKYKVAQDIIKYHIEPFFNTEKQARENYQEVINEFKFICSDHAQYWHVHTHETVNRVSPFIIARIKLSADYRNSYNNYYKWKYCYYPNNP